MSPLPLNRLRPIAESVQKNQKVPFTLALRFVARAWDVVKLTQKESGLTGGELFRCCAGELRAVVRDELSTVKLSSSCIAEVAESTAKALLAEDMCATSSAPVRGPLAK